MAEFTVGKVDGATGATGQLSASEWNQVAGLNNLITNSNQTPSTGDLTQLTKAVQNIATAFSSLIENGSSVADTYVFDIQTGFTAPTLQNGMRFKGLTQFPNTGACTINIAGTGAKAIKKSNGTTDIDANDITTFFEVEYNSGNDVYILVKTDNLLLPKSITIANNLTDSDHDIDFGAGNFVFDDYTGQATVGALTKQFDATFALGTNAGGMVSGESLPTSGAVYFYAISTPDGTLTDIIGTTTADGSTISSDSVVSSNNLTKKKRIGALMTDGSANIRNGTYTMFNGSYRFVYTTPINAFTGASPALNTTLSLDCPADSYVLLSGTLSHSGSACYYYLTSKVEGGDVLAGAIGDVTFARSSITPPFPILADANSQIEHGRTLGSASINLDLHGWIENIN